MDELVYQHKIKVLLHQVTSYHPTCKLEVINNAADLAYVAFFDKQRLDGSLQLEHAYAVAGTIANLKLDEYSIAAALLHEILEATDLTIDDLKETIDHEVIKLITGINKLKTYNTKSSDKIYYEKIRNLILASTDDIRIVVVRISDKYHNLKSRHSLEPVKRKEIAQKALEIYSPLLDLLGVDKLKRAIDDAAFEELNPEEFYLIKSHYESLLPKDNDIQNTLHNELTFISELFSQKVDIFSRVKSYYSTYKKYLQSKNDNESLEHYLNRLNDKLAFTILIEGIEECYSILSAVHNEWSYIKEQYDDYIITPKPNGYQGIHTIIRPYPDITCEIQIKTYAMHDYNENGPASHYYYKLGGRKVGSLHKTPDEKIAQLRELMNWQENVLSQNKSTLKLTSPSKYIYIFTPKGDVIELPYGATPIDFAYRVHSNLGNNMIGAVVNNKLVSLETPLKNGDVCMVTTDKNRKKPSPDWMRIAQTSYARSCIRRSLAEY